jgi:hypothetical protein
MARGTYQNSSRKNRGGTVNSYLARVVESGAMEPVAWYVQGRCSEADHIKVAGLLGCTALCSGNSKAMVVRVPPEHAKRVRSELIKAIDSGQITGFHVLPPKNSN